MELQLTKLMIKFETYVNNSYSHYQDAVRNGISIFNKVFGLYKKSNNLSFTETQVNVFKEMIQKPNGKELFELLIKDIYTATYHQVLFDNQSKLNADIKNWRDKLTEICPQKFDGSEYFVEEFMEDFYNEIYLEFLESNPKPIAK